MNKAITVLAAAAFVTAIGSAAMAQTAGPAGHFDNGYLDEHPEVTRQLEANPGLIDNRQYVEQHPGLHEYLENHPGVRTELREHPYRFMQAERSVDRWDKAHPMRSTDHYLDQHPEVAKQLGAHPGLVDNPKYMADHPGLREFFEKHPVARADWKSHPHRFLAHEEKYDKSH